MPSTRSGAPPRARMMRASQPPAAPGTNRTTARSPTPSAGAPRSAQTRMLRGRPASGRPCISPSISISVISTTPISGSAPEPRRSRLLARRCGGFAWSRFFLAGGFLGGFLAKRGRSFLIRLVGGGAAGAARSLAVVRPGGEQFHRLVERQGLGLDIARHRGIEAAMVYIGPVAPIKKIDRRAIRRMRAKALQWRRRAAARRARLGEQADRAVEPDRQHVVVLGDGAEILAVLYIRAEAADRRDDHLAILGMGSDVARQRQKLQRPVEIDIAGRKVFRHRGEIGLFLALAFAELHIETVGAFLQRDGQLGRGIDADL